VFFKTNITDLRVQKTIRDWKTTRVGRLQSQEVYKRQEIRKSQEVCHVSRNQNLKSLDDWESIRRGEKGRGKINTVSPKAW
jgi:hypothetical protein